MAGAVFVPGTIAVVTADGSARQVADGIAFPNGMAVTPDNSTLIMAESYGKKLTAFDIEVNGDTATAWSRWTWVVVGANGKPQTERAGHYEDTLVRERGEWKFKFRQA